MKLFVKLKFLENLNGKVEIVLENWLKKIHFFRKFAWKNLKFLDPESRPPRFQTRLTPLLLLKEEMTVHDHLVLGNIRS